MRFLAKYGKIGRKNWCLCLTFDLTTNARKRLETVFGLATMDGAGQFCRAEFAAAGALIDYVELTQVATCRGWLYRDKFLMAPFLKLMPQLGVIFELTKTLSGDLKGSLLQQSIGL